MLASRKTVRKYQGSKIARSADRIRKTGEVFTPDSILGRMTKGVDFSKPYQTFLDNTCGNGNILLYVLKHKLAAGVHWLDALCTIYGVELMEDNVRECRERLYDCIRENVKEWNEDNENVTWFVLYTNIVCHDALKFDYENWCPKGEKGPKQKAKGIMFIKPDDCACAFAYYLDENMYPLMIEAVTPSSVKEIEKEFDKSK